MVITFYARVPRLVGLKIAMGGVFSEYPIFIFPFLYWLV